MKKQRKYGALVACFFTDPFADFIVNDAMKLDNF